MIDFDYINESVYLTVTNDEPDRGITRIWAETGYFEERTVVQFA